MERDEYTCRRCNNKKDLDVHHIIKRKDGGTDDLSNLLSLCRSCHKTVDGRYFTTQERKCTVTLSKKIDMAMRLRAIKNNETFSHLAEKALRFYLGLV